MTLAHDIAGDGPCVVLLHSSVCDRRMWDPQWGLLVDAGFRVIRPDFRGYGETPPPTSGYDEARDIRDLLDMLGIESTALVGSSFGGRVAQEFAARWPSRVTRLLLLCPATRLLEPSDDLRSFGAAEDALLEAGDIEGAVGLNVRTWVGPAADESTRELVARMQRHAFEVQLAAPDVAADREDFDLRRRERSDPRDLGCARSRRHADGCRVPRRAHLGRCPPANSIGPATCRASRTPPDWARCSSTSWASRHRADECAVRGISQRSGADAATRAAASCASRAAAA